jgi:hypothetical protein
MSVASHVTPANLALVHGDILGGDEKQIVLGLPDTEYQLHLELTKPLSAPPSAEAAGVIRARARRVDVVRTGGRYLEPLRGRPRRVQGTILATDARANAITVACAPGCAMVCELTAGRTAELAVGALVSFDLEGAAAFEPMI